MIGKRPTKKTLAKIAKKVKKVLGKKVLGKKTA